MSRTWRRRDSGLITTGTEFWTPKRYVRGPGRPPTLLWGKHRIRNADGSIAFESEWMPNALANEGETDNLNTWLAGVAISTKFLCLLTATPTITTTMATMTEVFAPPLNGYARQQILTTDWSAPALSGSFEQTAAAEKIFGPAVTNPWNSLTYAALVTTATGTAGKFLLFVALSGTTTINVGQSFEYILKVQMQ